MIQKDMFGLGYKSLTMDKLFSLFFQIFCNKENSWIIFTMFLKFVTNILANKLECLFM